MQGLMATFFSALANRIVALVVVAFIASTSITFAAGSKLRPLPKKPSPLPPAPQKDARTYVAVPDVRRQAYVFAKGMLEDAGFAWRVEGSVQGFASNLVASQVPAGGTRVLDTGSPELVLRLQKNPGYDEQGLPENASPYKGTALVLAPGERPEKLLPAAKHKAHAAKPKSEERAEPKQATLTKQSSKKPTKAPAAKPAKAPAAKSAKAPAAKPAKATLERYRTPDFAVSGANREPANEMPLPARAHMIARRLETGQAPSQELVKWWLYQHAWVVTGARFGWQDGDRALRILVKTDEALYKRWGFGLKSAAVARDALQFVQSRKGT